MNQEKLLHIASHPHEISAEDARELDDLTRNFPYFTLPWVLLSKYYSTHNDYRFEDTLHKTALRVSDRSWLYDLIHSGPAAVAAPKVDIEEKVEAKTEVRELPVLQPETETSTAVEVSETAIADAEIGEQIEPTFGEISETVLPIEEITPISEPEIEPGQEEETASSAIEFSIDAEGLPVISTMIEFDENPAAEAIEAEEFPVFEEIETFDSIAQENPADIDVITEKADEIHTLQLPELMVMPDTYMSGASMVTPDTEASTIESEEEPETVAPDIKPAPRIEVSKFSSPVFSGGSVYNIEDYYPSGGDQSGPPEDFFSWLAHPGYEGGEKPAEPAAQDKEHTKKSELIDRFIQNKPGISQPKGDFFNAADVAKRSESLPPGLVTETLASVYRQQGNFAGAIRIYEALMLKFPQKSAYFAALTEKLKKEHNL